MISISIIIVDGYSSLTLLSLCRVNAEDYRNIVSSSEFLVSGDCLESGVCNWM